MNLRLGHHALLLVRVDFVEELLLEDAVSLLEVFDVQVSLVLGGLHLLDEALDFGDLLSPLLDFEEVLQVLNDGLVLQLFALIGTDSLLVERDLLLELLQLVSCDNVGNEPLSPLHDRHKIPVDLVVLCPLHREVHRHFVQ